MNSHVHTSYNRFRAFRFLWLLFILFHMVISSPGWTSTGNDFLNPSNHFFLAVNILVVIFSLISLFRPRDLLYFFLALLCMTVVKLDALPSVPNHLILALIIHFTLLLSLPLYLDTSLKFKEQIAQWFHKTAPYLRVELLIMYFFVVLHKLNYDYFNSSVSCSVELYTEIAGVFPFLPQGIWISWIMIVMTLLFELTIPVLLMIPRTRVLGVFAGLVFHSMLSLHPNLYILSFSAELYALYILFLPGEMITEAMTTLKQKTEQLYIKRALTVLAGLGFLGTTVYLAVRVLIKGTVTFSLLRDELANLLHVVQVVWIIWCLLLIAGAFFIFRGQFFYAPQKTSSPFRLSWSPLLLFPLLAFFNGITPYIGLKTATNFAMFSNLRVNGADTNHLFMPARYQLSDLQDDTVTLLSTNAPYLQGFIERDEYITHFELTRFLYENRSKEIHVHFRRDGKLRKIHLPQDDTDTWLESTWLARKLLLFRGVPESGPTPCQW